MAATVHLTQGVEVRTTANIRDILVGGGVHFVGEDVTQVVLPGNTNQIDWGRNLQYLDPSHRAGREGKGVWLPLTLVQFIESA